MSTLSHPRPLVQPDSPRIALPEILQAEPEPFQPSPEDEAWDTGYRLGRDGEDPCHLHVEPGTHLAREVAWAFVVGRSAGMAARELAEAREYRAGFAEGEAEFAADREFEAWVASEGEERAALAFATTITDFDMYPPGAVS